MSHSLFEQNNNNISMYLIYFQKYIKKCLCVLNFKISILAQHPHAYLPINLCKNGMINPNLEKFKEFAIF